MVALLRAWGNSCLSPGVWEKPACVPATLRSLPGTLTRTHWFGHASHTSPPCSCLGVYPLFPLPLNILPGLQTLLMQHHLFHEAAPHPDEGTCPSPKPTDSLCPGQPVDFSLGCLITLCSGCD